MLSVKNKSLLLIALLLIVFAVVMSVMIYNQQETKLIEVEKEYFKNVQLMHTKIVKKYEDFYTERLLENINTDGVKEAFYSNDREKVYALTVDKWEVLKKENEDMYIMQFHSKDGTVFLRMDDPEAFGDDIASYRGMIKKIHIEQKTLYGFDSCSGELVYRIIQPIFYKHQYIGALEFGIKPNYILNEMNYYHEIEGALFVQSCNKVEHYKKDYTINIGEYFLQYSILNDHEILKNIPKEYNFESFVNIVISKEKAHSIYSFDIKDFKGSVISKVVFFKDITKDVDEFDSNIISLVLFLISAVFIMLGVVDFGFNRTIKSLENSYADVSQYKIMINENVAIYSMDLDGVVIDVSDAFCEICGYTKDELVGRKQNILHHPDVRDEFYKKIWDTLKYKKTWNGEIKKIKKNGELYWVSVNIQAKFKDNTLIGYDAIMHDITDKKKYEELMVTDGLTGINNRRSFNDLFPRIISSTKREGGYLSFLILDIDHFKQFNDAYGHVAGDNALKEVSDVLKATINRGDDYCFRLGGEEFGVLFKSSNEKEALAFANKFKEAIISLNIKHGHNGNEGILTASFGLVTLNSGSILDEDEMYKMADEYLYKAKKNGRNRIESNIS